MVCFGEEGRGGGRGVVLVPVTEIVVGVAEVLVLKGGISHISRGTIVVAQKAPHLGLPSLFPSDLHRETDRDRWTERYIVIETNRLHREMTT